MSVNAVKFKLDSRAVPEGTILLFGIRYEPHPGSPLPANTKIYTYAIMKAGGFWYVTGGGRTPQTAGWGAVERWLERDGREVVWVKAVTETVTLWPPTGPSKVAGNLGDKIPDQPGPARDAWLKARGWGSFEEWQNRGEEPAEENCPHHPDDAGAGECRFDSCSWCGGYHCAWDQSVHEGV